MGVLLVSIVSAVGQPSPAAANDASYSSAVVADGAIGYWRLGEQSGQLAADSSGQNRAGTYSGPVQLGVPGAASGLTDTAISVDGSSQWVAVNDDAATRLNGSFTIEFWANQNSFVNQWPGVLGKGTGNAPGGYLIYATPDGRLSFKRNATEIVTAPGALVTGQWHHFAVTYDGTTLRWFVDGIANASAARSFPTNPDVSPLRLGHADQGGNNKLDEVALYPTALTAAKLANHVQLANTGGPPPPPPPQSSYAATVLADSPSAYWRLGEPSGAATAADASGQGRTGTYSGAVQLGVAGALSSSTDTAASFNGATGPRVTISDAASLRLNGAFTIEFWANQNSFANKWPGILGKGNGNSSNGFLIYAQSNGRLALKRNNTETLSATNALRTGQWHHYAVTYDGSTVRWFVDGVANSSTSRTYPANNNSASLLLGRADQGGNDKLDEIAFYPTALSASKLAAHVAAASSAPPPPPPPSQTYANTVLADGPAAFWRLGEPTGAPAAADASGHGMTGAYSGGVQTGVAGALVGSTDTATTFDGLSGHVAVADNAALRLNGSMSVEFWANQNGFVNSYPGLLRKGAAETDHGYLIYATPDGRLVFKRANQEIVTNPGALVTGQWHHFVVTYDGYVVRWYVDGSLNRSEQHWIFDSKGTDPLVIGRADEAGNNRLDEVAMYNEALAPSQISNHFRVGRGTSTAVPPGTPTNVQGVPGNASAGLQWNKPSTDGGTKITGYRVTISPGGATIDVPGWATSAQPDGLVNGTAYTFSVRAMNGAGIGSASSSSAPITPTASTPVAVRDTTAGGWPSYTHDLLGSGRNLDETILSVASAPTVTEKWRFNAGNAVLAQPSVGFGAIFVGDNGGFMRRMTTTGAVVWSTYIGITNGPCTGQGVVSSPTLAMFGSTRVIYVGGGDAQLYALNADTGAILWRLALGDPNNGAFAWTSPMLLNNALYMGESSLGDCPLTPGAMIKVDPATGRTLATAHMSPDGCLGGGIWGSPTFSNNRIFVTTGTQASCPVPVPLEISVVAMDPNTLAVVDSWHIPEEDQTEDGDFGSVPTVFDAPVPGTSGQLVAVANKNGVFYAFDQQNLGAGPVWGTQIAVAGPCPTCGSGAIAPAAYDGTHLYVAAGNTTTVGGAPCQTALRAIRPLDGSVVWEDCRNGALDGPTIGPISMANGVVLYCEGNYLNGVAAATGTRLFTIQTGLPDHSSVMYGGPSVSNGVIYAGGADGYLYAFAP